MDNTRLKRLKYRSWHRGCKETDILLGRFAEERLAGLDAAQADCYEKLLEEADGDIWNWLVGKESPPNPAYGPLLALIKDHTLPQTP